MARTIGDMMDDGGRVEENWLRRQTPGGLFLKVIGLFLVLGLIFGTIGFASGWFNTATQVVSPANVKEQWRFAYDYDNALGAIANNWCSAKKVEEAATGEAKDQRVSQRVAQENLYASQKSRYDAALQDAFRGKLVKPADVPNQAPTLAEKVNQLNLSCGSKP